ncbi:MAG: ribonuclease HI family protein [bacterium]|nr:ribonuclease HI family protein [bacterium]
MIKNDELFIFCDGGSRGNPGPAAAAGVIKNAAGKTRVLCGKYLGIATNNQAEYAAVELALQKIKENIRDVNEIRFYLDSKLVVNQLSGLYKTKDNRLREAGLRIRMLENGLGKIYYQHISREKNQEADQLVNEVLNTGTNIQRVFNE